MAIVKVQRDFGNRADRKVARHEVPHPQLGPRRGSRQRSKSTSATRWRRRKPIVVTGFNDGMGWHEQGDGKWFYGLNVENGRIKDEGPIRLKTALREICRTLAPPLRLTPHQSIIFCDLRSRTGRGCSKSCAATACR